MRMNVNQRLGNRDAVQMDYETIKASGDYSAGLQADRILAAAAKT
jgi:hypothetical protein